MEHHNRVPSPSLAAPLLEHSLDVDSDNIHIASEDSTDNVRARSATPGLRLTFTRGSSFGRVDSGTPTQLYALRSAPSNGTPRAHGGDGELEEVEVEIVTEAVVNAVAGAVGEVVNEVVQTAIEETRFNFKANVYTLIAVIGAVLLERGIWNLWGMWLGDSTLLSNGGSFAAGLVILCIIRALNLPLASTIPGR